MIYCEGTNCSRRDQCAFHEKFELEYPRQYLDESREGFGHEGIDADGNRFSHHEYICGDNAERYKCYKALGWRKGQEYRNSEGTICDEVCLHCQHKHLCFEVLELAGMVFGPGDRIRFNCESIKADPEGTRDWIDRKVATWKETFEYVHEKENDNTII